MVLISPEKLHDKPVYFCCMLPCCMLPRAERMGRSQRSKEKMKKAMSEGVCVCVCACLPCCQSQRLQTYIYKCVKLLIGCLCYRSHAGPNIVVDCSFAPTHCKPGLESRSLTKQVRNFYYCFVLCCYACPFACYARSIFYLFLLPIFDLCS